MCGRFFLAVDDPELREILQRIEDDNKRKDLSLPPVKTGEVHPSDYAVVVTVQDLKSEYEEMFQGFSQPNSKAVLINTRYGRC
jgi:putative SOS response-associated peptidase YedK